MQITFNPHDPADVATMQAALAALGTAPGAVVPVPPAAPAAAPPVAAQAPAGAPPPPAG